MRAFIALEIPEEVKKEIEKIQKDLEKGGIQARWVKPKLSHLTLAFLGSITPDKAKLVETVLEEAARQVKPANLSLQKIGCFPSPARARIIFVDLGGELGKLNALALKIRKGLKKERVYFDKKPFVSHITLGRIRKKKNLSQSISKTKVKKVKFVARRISLTQSTLTGGRPVYKPLKRVFLKNH